MADLMRISGVGCEYSGLLEAASVDTVKELRNHNTVNRYYKNGSGGCCKVTDARRTKRKSGDQTDRTGKITWIHDHALNNLNFRSNQMSIARITEISATSSKSFEDAINLGIARASKTLRNVTGAWVKEQKVAVTKGKISEYRVNMEITFILEE